MAKNVKFYKAPKMVALLIASGFILVGCKDKQTEVAEEIQQAQEENQELKDTIQELEESTVEEIDLPKEAEEDRSEENISSQGTNESQEDHNTYFINELYLIDRSILNPDIEFSDARYDFVTMKEQRKTESCKNHCIYEQDSNMTCVSYIYQSVLTKTNLSIELHLNEFSLENRTSPNHFVITIPNIGSIDLIQYPESNTYQKQNDENMKKYQQLITPLSNVIHAEDYKNDYTKEELQVLLNQINKTDYFAELKNKVM